MGIIGLGHMDKLNLMICKRINSIKVVGVADKSKRALKFANEYGIDFVFRDYKEMLETIGSDAVIISLPNFLHMESIKMAALKGIDIYVDEPLARSVGECQEIEKSIKKHGVILMLCARIESLKKE